MEDAAGISKLTHHIFSGLEHNWLLSGRRRKTRILAVDGGVGPSALIAATALVRLESLLQSLSGDPSARIPDYFDLIAGTGLGGVLAVLITASVDSRPLLSASEASELLISNLPLLFRRRRGVLRRPRRQFSAASFEAVLQGTLKGMTLRDACRPLLVPCYDLGSGAAFVFSRADATEAACYDFELSAVCRATAATPGLFGSCKVRSVDGRTECEAVDGGVVMNNPTATAVTHVLHNKREFPHVRGVDDLAILSLGNGTPPVGSDKWRSSDMLLEIVMHGVSDTVHQILTNAFAWNPTNYVRIQANGLLVVEDEKEKSAKKKKEDTKMTVERLKMLGEMMLKERGLEALPFGGKRLMEETNEERMEAFVRWLVSPAPLDVKQQLLLLPLPTNPPIEKTNVVELLEDGC